jgi:hypothetical protein
MQQVIETVPNHRVDRVVVVRAGGRSWLHHPLEAREEHRAQARDLVTEWECEALRSRNSAA